jgi:D-lactate dehydrogenase
VIIYFTETEPEGEEFFANSLPEHDVRFASRLDDVGADAEILSCFIYSKIDSGFLAAHPSLKLVTTRSTSVEHIDAASCHARGVVVCSVPFFGDATVAEHTFALILALSRRLREVMLTPKNGRFSYEATRGFELAGKTLGIIGMGRIGQRVAELAHAFQMRVVAYDVQQSAATAQCLDFEFVTLDELLASSHVISLHASLSAKTYHILDGEALSKCRRGVLVVNTARGSLLDTQALREALDSGQVGGAGLDVLQDERVMRDSASRIIAADIIQHLRTDALATDERDADRIRELQELMLSDDVLSRSNVVFTPHVAFNSVEAMERVRRATLENISGFVAGHPVNVFAAGTAATASTTPAGP